MANIAEIGFRAPTGDLKNAKAALDALTPSAQKAEKAAENFNRAASGITGGTNGASAGIRSFVSAAMGATAGTNNLTKAALSSGTAMGTVQRAALGAAAPLGNLVQVTARLGPTFAQADAHVEAYRASLAKVPAAAMGAKTSLDRLGAAANDNINRLQSTPGNIAAQFQDIGVTAAGGMSPLLIALQQGTQLSSAMAGGVGNLIAGFRQLFSVTTILTIGLVGLAAAGLQNVDWMGLAQTLLYAMATGFEMLSGAIEQYTIVLIYAGVVALIAFGPAIYTAVLNLAAAIIGKLIFALGYASAAMLAFAAANPFGVIAIAIGVVIGAMVLLNDTFGGVFTDVLSKTKTLANAIIGAFVGAFNVIKAVFNDIPNVLSSVVYRSKKALNDLVKIRNTATGESNSLFNFDVSGGDPGNGALSNAIAEFGKAQGIDYAKGIGEGISSGLGWMRDKFRGWGDMIGVNPTEDGGSDDTARGRIGRTGRTGMSELEKLAKAYNNIVKGAQERITALKIEANALEMTNNAAHLYRIEQELIAQATSKGIPLTQAMTEELKGLAAQISKGELDNAFRGMLKNINEQSRDLSDAADQIGKYGYELEYVKNTQNLMNTAVDLGIIDLDNMTEAMRIQVAMLENRAASLAKQTVRNDESEAIEKATRSHQENMIALSRERNEINLTGKALQMYRLETDLLIEAQRGVDSPEYIEALRQQGVEYIDLTDKIRRQREEIEFYRDTNKGFFADMINGLREGKSVWEAFGDAVMNVVNKIIDRLLNSALDGLFNNKDGGAGGLLGSIGKLIGGFRPSASLVADVGSNIAANPDIFARGGTFGVERFAQGGAFTNGIYSKPTLFKFAGGGALGEMGEAGPEAVMPLKRGPNGSLGVEIHRSAPVHVVVTTNDDRFDAYVDNRAEGAVARGAPAIADAGGRVGQARAAFTRSRTIGGR